MNLGFTNIDFENLYKYYIDKTPVNEFVHQRLMDLFYIFLFIGGMPQVVNEYIISNNLGYLVVIQSIIIEQYKLDFAKYENKD